VCVCVYTATKVNEDFVIFQKQERSPLPPEARFQLRKLPDIT